MEMGMGMRMGIGKDRGMGKATTILIGSAHVGTTLLIRSAHVGTTILIGSAHFCMTLLIGSTDACTTILIGSAHVGTSILIGSACAHVGTTLIGSAHDCITILIGSAHVYTPHQTKLCLHVWLRKAVRASKQLCASRSTSLSLDRFRTMPLRLAVKTFSKKQKNGKTPRMTEDEKRIVRSMAFDQKMVLIFLRFKSLAESPPPSARTRCQPLRFVSSQSLAVHPTRGASHPDPKT